MTADAAVSVLSEVRLVSGRRFAQESSCARLSAAPKRRQRAQDVSGGHAVRSRWARYSRAEFD
jgi:hypothetical protein